MFTGCIKETGVFHSLDHKAEHAVLRLETILSQEARAGDSIAVNGACLTVTTVDKSQNRIEFNLLDETLKRTNLGQLSIRPMVNLERALMVGDRLDGHFVMGHIDAVASVLAVEIQPRDGILRIHLPTALRAFAIVKGSIAVDGVSLTIVELNDEDFTVHIIPYTWEHTNLHTIKPGDQVNLEMDMIGKYVARSLSSSG